MKRSKAEERDDNINSIWGRKAPQNRRNRMKKGAISKPGDFGECLNDVAKRLVNAFVRKELGVPEVFEVVRDTARQGRRDIPA